MRFTLAIASALLVCARSAIAATRPRGINAERFSRGLPPAAPKRRWDATRALSAPKSKRSGGVTQQGCPLAMPQFLCGCTTVYSTTSSAQASLTGTDLTLLNNIVNTFPMYVGDNVVAGSCQEGLSTCPPNESQYCCATATYSESLDDAVGADCVALNAPAPQTCSALMEPTLCGCTTVFSSTSSAENSLTGAELQGLQNIVGTYPAYSGSNVVAGSCQGGQTTCSPNESQYCCAVTTYTVSIDDSVGVDCVQLAPNP